MAQMDSKSLSAALDSLNSDSDNGEDLRITESFSKHRLAIHGVLYSAYFDVFIATLIFTNLVLIIVETDEHAVSGKDPATWVRLCNYVLLAIYTVEVTLRIYVMRMRFFSNFVNLIDISCVGTDLVSEVILQSFGADVPALSIFRLLRLARLARTVKFVLMFPQLSLIVKSLLTAYSAIAWGIVLIFLMLILWSVIAVQVIHPLNKEVADMGLYEGCERCPRAFESVTASVITFCEQVIAGGSWGQLNIVIMEHSPSSAIFFFFAVFVTLDIAIMNVILAAIVQNAQKFSEAPPRRQRILHTSDRT